MKLFSESASSLLARNVNTSPFKIVHMSAKRAGGEYISRLNFSDCGKGFSEDSQSGSLYQYCHITPPTASELCGWRLKCKYMHSTAMIWKKDITPAKKRILMKKKGVKYREGVETVIQIWH